jgi:outer membrane protein assembly factor BamB
MKRTTGPTTGRSGRGRRLRVLAATLALVAVAAAVVGVVVGGRDDDGVGLRLLPTGSSPAGPAESVAWWSPVRGEPLGVAVADDDVAVTALDEVRLLDAADGRIRWKAEFPGVRRYRPAVGADRVAATSETELLVLDRATGRRIAAVPFDGPGPAAVVAGGPGRAVVVAGSEDGGFLAVDAATGDRLWSVAHPGQVTVAPRGDAGVVVASWHDHSGATLRAFDATSGRLRWETVLGPMAGAPLLVSGIVVVTDGEGIHTAFVRALELGDGLERWRVPLPGWWDDELEAAAEPPSAYLLDGLGTVVALDLRSGELQWRRETGRPLVSGRVALTPDAVVFASYDDELMVLDRATGHVRATEPQRGVPVDVAGRGSRGSHGLVVALRLAVPSRVEARSP